MERPAPLHQKVLEDASKKGSEEAVRRAQTQTGYESLNDVEPLFRLEDLDLQSILDRAGAANELEVTLQESGFEAMTLDQQEAALKKLCSEFELRQKLGTEDINRYRHLAEAVAAKLHAVLEEKYLPEKLNQITGAM